MQTIERCEPIVVSEFCITVSAEFALFVADFKDISDGLKLIGNLLWLVHRIGDAL